MQTEKPPTWSRTRLLYLAGGILICVVAVVMMVMPH